MQGADQGDTTTIAETVTTAERLGLPWLCGTDGHTAIIDEVVADKGYHSNQTLVDLATHIDLRTYIAEPDRGRPLDTRRRRATWCTRIVDASGACVGWPCRVDGVSISNDRMRISMKPVGCGARICEGTPTS